MNLESLRVGSAADPLSEWPELLWLKSVRVAFFIIASIVCTLAFHNVLIFGAMQEVGSLDNEYTVLLEKRNNLDFKKRELEQYKDDFIEMKSFFKRISSFIPTSASIEDILRALHDISSAIDIEIQEVKPLPQENKGIYSELPVQVKMQSSFLNFGQFCERVAATPQLFNVEVLEISPQQNVDSDNVNFIISIKMPFYTEI